ncbi:MAG: lasso peptide biosynthesis B2 protein [Solirubrobacterales bacterium]
MKGRDDDDGRRGRGEKAALGLEIVVAYVRARRELRRAPIDQVVERLRPLEPGEASPPGPDEREEARSLGWVVVRTLRFLPGDTRCLRRSLVLLQLLARRRIPSRLVIGVRTRPDFLGHAWVECGGVPVLSPLDGSFGRLVEL